MEKFKVVERRITDPFEIIEIGKFNELTNKFKGEPRLCSNHNFPIEYKYESTGNPHGAPFNIILNGCCEESIEKEIQFIKAKLQENRQTENFI